MIYVIVHTALGLLLQTYMYVYRELPETVQHMALVFKKLSTKELLILGCVSCVSF
jgi:hypothetical protein